MRTFKTAVILVTCLSILILSGCSILKKKCDCPPVGNKINILEKTHA